LLDAANTIACDLIPLMVAGFRLQRTQTFRSCRIIIVIISQLRMRKKKLMPVSLSNGYKDDKGREVPAFLQEESI